MKLIFLYKEHAVPHSTFDWDYKNWFIFVDTAHNFRSLSKLSRYFAILFWGKR